MRVLLTGASGFLGGYVLQALQDRRIDTVAIGRRCPARLAATRFFGADLLDAAQRERAVRASGASHLLHLAWVTEHGSYWDSPENQRWQDATERLVEAFAVAGGSHVAVAGSCAEYTWDGPGVWFEDVTPERPATRYGQSKDATRRHLQTWCGQHGITLAWGRVFYPFGAGEDPRRLVPSLVAALRLRAPLFGVNAEVQRDFLHADDVASALVALLQPAAIGVFNLSSGVATPIGDLVRLIARQLGADAQSVLRQTPARAAGPQILVGDNRRLRALGWTQGATFEKSLARTVAQLTSAEAAPEYGA